MVGRVIFIVVIAWLFRSRRTPSRSGVFAGRASCVRGDPGCRPPTNTRGMGGLTAVAVLVVAYAMIASKLDRWWITGPMVFVAAGTVLGPGGLAVLPVALGDET